MLRPSLLICLTTALAPFVAAQNICPDGGFGGVDAVLDLGAATGTDGHVGVQRIGDRYYVATRRRNAASNHRVLVLDARGQSVAASDFDQPAALAGSPWGLRDLTTDGACLVGASELGVFGFDTTGAPCTTIVTANGPRPFIGPIAGAALARLGALRGVAYDLDGNGGEGSFWAANLTSDLVEFDLQGAVLTVRPNLDDWCIQGLAVDPCSATLWAFSAPDRGPVVELDLTTGRATGREIDAFARGAQGGLCTFTDGAARRLAWIAQGERDLLVVATLHTVDGLCDAPVLVSSIDGGSADRAFKVAEVGSSSLELALVGGGAQPLPGVLFINLGADALTCGDVSWLGPSWATLAPFSVATSFSVPSGVAIEIPTNTGARVSLPLTALPASTAFRAQAVHLELAVTTLLPGVVGVFPSNEVELGIERRPAKGVFVSATGHSSLVGDPVGGFFAIRHDGPDAIQRLEFEAVGGMVFDYDEQTSAGALWAGNSTVWETCRGAYRKRSDITAGLDYATTPPAGCDPAANRGFLEFGVHGETLSFPFSGNAFANGVTFAFDCDTDGGEGPSARDMDGMRVRVTFASGEVRSAVLRADPSGAMQAAASL